MKTDKAYYEKSETYSKAELNALLENVLREMKTYINQKLYEKNELGLTEGKNSEKPDVKLYNTDCRYCNKPISLERKSGKWLVYRQGTTEKHNCPGGRE